MAADVFYLHLDGKSLGVLNIVCQGSNFQVCTLVGETVDSTTVWDAFLRTWVRYFGPPDLLTTDGGPEFGGRMERGCEQWGVLQHVVDSESPWQNGRAERHGGWVKEKIETELASPDRTVKNV